MFEIISKRKFEAYFYGRSPFVKQYTSEVSWYHCKIAGTTLLAVALYCHIDEDYNLVILARDLAKRFRAVRVFSSYANVNLAIEEATKAVPSIIETAIDGLIKQGDEAISPFSIFASKIQDDKKNRYLKMLLNDPTYYPAKIAMEELAHWYDDPDGIFIRGLQGNEFNSRLFELYLQAAFYELDFTIDHSHAQPDYLLSKGDMVVAVEAATVAELEDGSDETEEPIDLGSLASLREHVEKAMPFKFQRTLAKKVRHKPEPLKLPYWDLPHTKGHPFVIAVHDYSRAMSMATSQGSLQKFLYGLEVVDGVAVALDRHEYNGRTIASNFFAQPGNRHVSAVMLATGATIPKFNRMGRLAGILSPNSVAVVHGVRTDSEGIPRGFKSIVEGTDYQEAWHDGIFMFHNPNAVTPLVPELFPRVVHCFMRDEGLIEILPPDYIISSVTQMLILKPPQGGDTALDTDSNVNDTTSKSPIPNS